MSDGGAITIRAGRREDAAALAAWHRMHDWCYDAAAVLAEYHDDAFEWSSVLVAEEAGEAVGKIELFIGYKSSYGRFGLIRRLVVRPDKRGAGVGRLLLNAATDWAEREGLRFLELTTEETNRPAWTLYERAGFAPVRTEIILRKPLGTLPLPEEEARG